MLGVTEILELHWQCGVEDVNASTLLVGHVMMQRKECSQDHLEIQLQGTRAPPFSHCKPSMSAAVM